MALLPENRSAVITIQGGGIHGLHLLGQLRAVVEAHKYGPLALAGTSAGAIVSSLLWAGYTPTEIAEEFIRMARRADGSLSELLGPFEPPPEPAFRLEELGDVFRRIDSLLRGFMKDP